MYEQETELCSVFFDLSKVHDTADHSEAEFDGEARHFTDNRCSATISTGSFHVDNSQYLLFFHIIFMQTTLFCISDSVRLDVENLEFSFNTGQPLN